MNPRVTENRADAVDETASQGTGGDETEIGRPAAEQAMLFNDEPTLLDRLNRSELVKRVGNAIIGCRPPVVLGIHGDWGAGKTSFLHQLHFYLKGECPQRSAEEIDEATCPRTIHPDTDYLTIVWFEAWRYQNEPVPIAALLQEIRTQLPWYSKALAETKKLGEIAMRSALLSLDDLTKKIGLQAATVKTIQETGEKWEQENLATSLPAHMIRAHLDHALGQLLGRDAIEPKPRGRTKADKPRRQAYRLVVLVDDLDRCEPDAAFKLLEGIKIYLNLPSCIFVLGMNQWIIERAIAKQLKAESSDEDRRYALPRVPGEALPGHLAPAHPGRWVEVPGILAPQKCSPESVGARGHQSVSLPARQPPKD